ncbi:DUF7278 family profilin-like fold-containing protein [Enterococcus alishanensis]|uniref:DUF7278 domain-containing protein n=1 Tax=Enterococcus alishanensis TaxID=1303817 RepID=A0ABS6TBB2_9ENTE|nr:hypothetical protein [Enterococcus alishanensis]MBV7390192.1 hypothetical protein [Enterococcus alishanensis]
MNLVDQLDWAYWKRLNPKEKRTLLSQVLLYYVNPLLKISDIELKEFELYGIKCETFELLIDEEKFVFVPGNKEAILGWNLGAKGLSLLETAQDSPNISIPEEILNQYNLLETESLANYINDKTTRLRKSAIPAMFVQRYALPAGTEFLGRFDAVTGSFEGRVDLFAKIEKEIKEILTPKLNSQESLIWTFPESFLMEDSWYIELEPESDLYRVYTHTTHNYTSLRKEIRKKNFDLLTEDQWEYCNGAGSRRLFRWGNDLNMSDPYRGKAIKKMIQGLNMFGLSFDTKMTRFEITEDPGVLKLTDHQEKIGIPAVEYLPLSSYYSNSKMLHSEVILFPQKYLYRKAIVLKV